MKIVMFSINPIFPEVVTGGASKHLYQIAQYLGSLSHDVEIYCAQTKENADQFKWGNRVTVMPILPFNLPFPQPYAVSGADLAVIAGRLSSALKNADRFYIHDGEWLIPDVYETIPTITSFRDNIYPESVLGTFITKADDLICVSEYSAAVIQQTAGRFYPGLKERIHQVNNGIDFNVFSQVDQGPLAKELGLDPDEEIILLHPHRPEAGKGLPETIQVVNRLVHQHGLGNIKVLVPEWIGEMVSSRDSDFYNAMMHLMGDLGVRDHFMFIPWISIDRMPELYSLGAITLCLGNIVEAFGNVAYESLACGTPSIVARVGVHRTLMPDTLIDKVHFGDIDSAAARVMAILDGRIAPSEDVLAFMHDEMNFENQVNAYAEIITTCKKRDKLQFSNQDESGKQAFVLAPWCYIDGRRIYHDFHGSFESAGRLAQLFSQSETNTQDSADDAGISNDTWQDWINKTYIIPEVA